MDVLLDTNAFKSKKLLKLLHHADNINVHTSVIVELEHYSHLLVRGKTKLWDSLTKQLKIKSLPITRIEAKLAALFAKSFLSHPKGPSYFFRDCLIGATAVSRRIILVTNNSKDFGFLEKSKVLSIDELIGILESNSQE